MPFVDQQVELITNSVPAFSPAFQNSYTKQTVAFEGYKITM